MLNLVKNADRSCGRFQIEYLKPNSVPPDLSAFEVMATGNRRRNTHPNGKHYSSDSSRRLADSFRSQSKSS